MEPIDWVQRVRTSGGLAPATGCDAAHAGAVVRVPYTATYCFFASATRGQARQAAVP
jgi:hypothetical protein